MREPAPLPQVSPAVDLRAIPAEKWRKVLHQFAAKFAERFIEECHNADDEERARCANIDLSDDESVRTVEVDDTRIRLETDELWCEPGFDMNGRLSSVAVYYRGKRVGKPFQYIPAGETAGSEKKVKVFIDTGRGGKQAFWVPASAA